MPGALNQMLRSERDLTEWDGERHVRNEEYTRRQLSEELYHTTWQGLQETDASDVVQDDDTSEDQHLHISSREIGCRQGQARAEWGLKFIPFVDTSG